MVKNDFQKRCITSIFVILLYFIWPSILKALSTCLSIHGTVLDFYNVIGNLLLVGILLFLYRKDLKQDWLHFKKNEKHNIVFVLKYTILLCFLIIICNMCIQLIFHIETINNESLLYQQFTQSPLITMILLTIYYPIVEMIVFQKTIKQVIHKKWLFIMISSLFFGYFNIAFSNITVSSILESIPYIVSNALLAYCYIKSDTIVAPSLIKIFYNCLVTIIHIL